MTKLNSVLRFYRGGTFMFDLNDGGQYEIGEPYIPALPESAALSQPVQEAIPYYVYGATWDDVLNNHIAVNRALEEALDYTVHPASGNYWEVETQGAGGTYLARAMVLGGVSSLEPGGSGFKRGGGHLLSARANLNLTRVPMWEKPQAAISLVTSPSDNGANDFAVLPSLAGERPSALLLRVTGGNPTAGNIADCKRVIMGLRANGNPANFIHQLQIGDTTGYTVSYGAKAATATEAVNFLSAIGGTKKRLRYTPDDLNFNTVATWEITANVIDQFGRLLALVRYRDNSAAGSDATAFYLRFRAGVKSGATVAWGPYWGVNGDGGYATLRADSSATTELFVLDLGQGQVPATGTGYRTVSSIVYQLEAQATTLTGPPTLDIDYVDLFPVGEAGLGAGLLLADLPVAIGSNRVYLDGRLRQEPAYLTDTNDLILVLANDYDYLGEVSAWPNRTGQRIYLMLLRGPAEYCKHSFVTSLSLSAWATPRYHHMAGTV